MSEHSSIEWTDATWNPLRGCTKLSPGCKHCYAERFAERFRGVPGHPFEQGFDLRLVPEKLAEPVRWKAPRSIFVNSMSDLFLAEVPQAYLEAVLAVMAAARWHTFQVLTKRAERMREQLNRASAETARLPHLWWGVSVEDRRYGLPRLRALQATRVAHRFLSVEPLLEDLGELDLTGIDWVIAGGETGPGARPLERNWIVSLQRQCARAKVPFFFKQWGGVQKKRNGRLLDGRTWDEVPLRPAETAPAEEERLQLLARFEQSSPPRPGPAPY